MFVFKFYYFIKIKIMFISKLLPFILIALIITINSMVWSKINLPYVNLEDVKGVYSLNNYSVYNDTFRFLIYIFSPLIFFFIYNFFIKYKKNTTFKNLLKIDKITRDDYNEYVIILLLFLPFIFISFLSIDFPLYKLDIFHEGQLLSGATNYLQKLNFWNGSFLLTGLFYDQLNTVIAFKLFNLQSVGVYRVFQIILQYSTLIFIVIFCLSLSKNIKIKKNLKRLFIIFFILFGLYLVKENFIYYRHIPIILFLIFLNKITLDHTKKINYMALGVISSFAFFWSIDVGAYVFVALFTFIIILIYNNKIKETALVFLSFFILFIFTSLFLEQGDFSSFISNTLNQYRFNELYNGIIHPEPFSNQKDSARATKTFIIFILNGLILINIFFQRNKFISNEFYIFLILFYIISIFSYKTGLVRSDGGHIKLGSGFTVLLFVFLSMIKLFYFLEVQNFIIKNVLLKITIIFTLILITTLILLGEKNSLKNIISFKSSFFKTINKNDSYYLDKDYIEIVNELKYLTNNLECFQAFNYEPSIYYLIKKKSCTKYYQIYSIGSKSDQKTFVNEMEEFNPKYILTGGNYEDWGIKPSIRFPLINDYVIEKYKIYKQVNNHKIWILID